MDLNPYESPTTAPASRPVRGADLSDVPYVSASGLAYAAAAALAIMAVVELALVGSKVMQIDLLERMRAHAAQLSEITANDARERLLASAYLLVNLVCIVIYLMWSYRANRNLRPLGTRGIEFTPGWAVGWWFVPFANLVRPYQVAKEIYLGSDPEVAQPQRIARRSGPIWMRCWWAFWLLGNVASWGAVGGDPKSIDSLSSASYVAAFSSASHVIAALLAVQLVVSSNRRQEQRYAMLEAGPEAATALE